MSLEPQPIPGAQLPPGSGPAVETQLTRGQGGRVLANTGVWSPDSRWIVYDVRSDPAGDAFDGSRIEMVNVETGEVKVLYESSRGAHCGVVTFRSFSGRRIPRPTGSTA